MRAKLWSVGWVAVAGIAGAQPPSAAVEPALPGWMAGCWIDQKGDAWVEECRTSARGGMMIGSGRTGEGDRVKLWEAMQIIRDETRGAKVGLSFWAAPRGINRTQFRLRADAAPGVTFVNDANDYPQRIRYWREGEFLMAETALTDGSKARRWRFKRM